MKKLKYGLIVTVVVTIWLIFQIGSCKERQRSQIKTTTKTTTETLTPPDSAVALKTIWDIENENERLRAGATQVVTVDAPEPVAPKTPRGWVNTGIGVLNPTHQTIGDKRAHEQLAANPTIRTWIRVDNINHEPITLTKGGKFWMVVNYPLGLSLTSIHKDAKGHYKKVRLTRESVNGPDVLEEDGVSRNVSVAEAEKAMNDANHVSFFPAHGGPKVDVEVGFLPSEAQPLSAPVPVTAPLPQVEKPATVPAAPVAPPSEGPCTDLIPQGPTSIASNDNLPLPGY